MREIFSFLQIRLLAAFAALVLIAGAILRIALFTSFSEDFNWRFFAFLRALFLGVANDLSALSYLLIIPAIFILYFNDYFYAKTRGKIYLSIVVFLFVFFVFFTAIAEFLFWGSFHSRFNYIAVDYFFNRSSDNNALFNNYRIVAYLSAIAAIGASSLILKKSVFSQSIRRILWTPRLRLALFWIHVAIAVLIFFVYSPISSEDRFFQALERNGIYELFSAKRSGRIDYRSFYPKAPREQAFKIAINEAKDNNAAFLSEANRDFRKTISVKGDEKTFNTIVIIAKNLDRNSIGENTPYINKALEESFEFSNMRSTGADRTIEAITLSVPPIAGEPIARRLKNGEINSWARMFQARNYARLFIYGDYGFFDNIDRFASLSGYESIDRDHFAPENINFETKQKLADEDLFNEAIMRADRFYAQNKPFHQLLLTSSNEFPYRFPSGRLNDANFSKEGALRYFDYALGRYIEKAKTKSWFNNTIFVVVGDSDLEDQNAMRRNSFKIVSFFYAPKLISAGKSDILCSTIDVAPTLFGLLGWSYESRFFGRDIFAMSKEDGRAWIATKTLLGFIVANGDFIVLRPMKAANTANESVRRAVATYQTAFDLFDEGRLLTPVDRL
ncbi:MAG: LTA synthase family protein [Helicobacteraceae bacterium]|jgi:phosphoglycerol transferase MdoB-like AlkP superfamily enzyme|nr:LTA synthase family protein [Helicobacteraceae bacterium]